jgi:hypothetical protein
LVAGGGKQFGIPAPGAGYGGKFPVLDIEKLGYKATGCPYFAGFKLFVAAFRADVFFMLHGTDVIRGFKISKSLVFGSVNPTFYPLTI